MSRNTDPLLYGNTILFNYKEDNGFFSLFKSSVTVTIECNIEMYGKHENVLSEQTGKVVIKPLDNKYSSRVYHFSDIKKDILRLNPQFYIRNS